MGLSILGTGKYLPAMVITNEDMAKIVDTNDEWITSRTGIKTRRITDGVLTYEMGANAAKEALQNANLQVSDIDMIITTTVTGDFISPTTSAMIANALGSESAICIDINCACAGFVYALDMAKHYLQDGEYNNILIVSAEQLSKITDYSDRSTCVLFADGAGACIVSKNENMFYSVLGSQPKGVDKLFAKGILPNNPFMKEQIDRSEEKMFSHKDFALYMEGQDVYKFATSVMPLALKQACEKANIALDDIDLIIPHQANIRIVETAAKHLKLPMSKFLINIDKYGNTSSASVAISLAEAAQTGRIKKGDKIAFVAFGAGLTYAAVVMEY
ncbi:MAG: beta-ketoacyl-ACP synthase III [Oscillospiraceae bacterium]